MSAASSPTDTPTYSERLYMPIGWWAGALVMTVVLELQVWMYLPIHPAITLSVPVLLVSALLASAGLTKIEVTADLVHIGKFSVPCRQVASVEELDQRNTRRAAGVGGDPAAVTLLRPWIQSASKVVCVGNEPPYALVSTRHPEKFSAAVVACATAAAE
ncbi:DUF3093 domain-containing protein [Cumulibacter soli]|uniref:DUF3093 domain-containing protein n=1 Tax=Cumulibacter soli TaxID=2546344 RepID=UPI00106871B5|nr:DUF3093 domain-containing protein [Cumulibacter soli]